MPLRCIAAESLVRRQDFVHQANVEAGLTTVADRGGTVSVRNLASIPL